MVWLISLVYWSCSKNLWADTNKDQRVFSEQEWWWRSWSTEVFKDVPEHRTGGQDGINVDALCSAFWRSCCCAGGGGAVLRGGSDSCWVVGGESEEGVSCCRGLMKVVENLFTSSASLMCLWRGMWVFTIDFACNAQITFIVYAA